MTNTNTNTNDNGYSLAVSESIKAVQTGVKSENQYLRAGDAVLAFFGSEEAIREVKAQFIVDAVIPGLDKKHQSALKIDLVRKNSKEYQAYDANMRHEWHEANEAKKTARSIADIYFNRIVGYAFPKVKAESDSDSTTDLKTKINEAISNLIKKCQKTESANFDVNVTIQALQNVLTTVNR